MTPVAAYPRREPFFSAKFIRLMVKVCLAQELGQGVFALLVTIAATEDSKRYRGPVTFYNGQLLPLLWFKKWESLDAARRAAVERAWLHYEPPPPGMRTPGLYWVTIPAGVAALPDTPVDEPTADPLTAEYLRGYADGKAGKEPQPYPPNGEGHEQPSPPNGYASGDGAGYGRGYGSGDGRRELPILSLSPIPNPNREAAPLSPDGDSLTIEALIGRWNAIKGVVHCREATSARRKAFRARIKDRLWLANVDAALAAVARSAFCAGDNDRGWKADLDFFLRPDTVTKILEGKYDSNGKPKSRVSPGQVFDPDAKTRDPNHGKM